MTDDDARRFLEASVLESGESIVWSGRPASAEALRQTGFDAVVGLGLGALALWLVVRGAMADVEVLIGLPLLAIGLWIVTTPQRHRWLAGRLFYAVTDRRVLIVADVLGRRVHAVEADRIATRHRLRHEDGSSSFDFARMLERGPGESRAEARVVDGIWGVADGDGAERALEAVAAREAT